MVAHIINGDSIGLVCADDVNVIAIKGDVMNMFGNIITNEASHSPEIFIGTGDTVEEARKAAKDKYERGIK